MIKFKVGDEIEVKTSGKYGYTTYGSRGIITHILSEHMVDAIWHKLTCDGGNYYKGRKFCIYIEDIKLVKAREPKTYGIVGFMKGTK